MFLAGYLDKLSAFFHRPFIFHPGYAGLPFEVSYINPLDVVENREEKKTSFEKQAVLDWPRRIENRYRLAGVPIKVVNGNQAIEDLEDLKRLFKTHIAIGVQEQDRNAFVDEVILHCHQGGLIHNTGAILSKMYQAERMELLRDPSHKEDVSTLQFLGDVTFYPIRGGIGVLEKNRLTQIVAMKKDDEDSVENFEFDQTSPVEVLTYSTMTFDMARKILVISTPKVQTIIKDERMYDLLDIKKTTQALAERLWEKSAEAATHIKQLASKVKGDVAKTMLTWMASKERQQASLRTEANDRAKMDMLTGQLEAHCILLHDKMEEASCLTESTQHLLEDRHPFYLSLIGETQLSCSFYSDVLSASMRTIEYVPACEEEGKRIVLDWKCLSNSEAGWANARIEENTLRFEELTRQLRLLKLEYAAFSQTEQIALQEKFTTRCERLTYNISSCQKNIHRLRHFLRMLPHNRSFEKPLPQSIAALKVGVLTHLIRQQIASCQHYDVTALSMSQTLRQLAVWHLNCNSLIKDAHKVLDLMGKPPFVKPDNIRALIDAIKGQLKQFEIADILLKKGKSVVEENMHAMEHITDMNTTIRKEQENYSAFLSALPSMAPEEIKEHASSFFKLPQRPSLAMALSLPFWAEHESEKKDVTVTQTPKRLFYV